VNEYTLVDTPTIFPQACICGSQKGPLVDTFITTAGLRLYVCSLCATRIGRALGLLKGERHTQLLKAGDLLTEAAKGIEERDKQIETQMAELAARARKIEALEELLNQARDSERTKRHLLESINESSRQLLQVAS
jgi:hypothetical protein